MVPMNDRIRQRQMHGWCFEESDIVVFDLAVNLFWGSWCELCSCG